jgi:hypothetical protein
LELARAGESDAAQRLLGVLQRNDPDGLGPLLHAKVFRLLARTSAVRAASCSLVTYRWRWTR